MATNTPYCPKHGPLTAFDVVTETTYDSAAGTILDVRTCWCGETVRRGA